MGRKKNSSSKARIIKLNLSNLRFQAIIHSTEDPEKVYIALNALLPPTFEQIKQDSIQDQNMEKEPAYLIKITPNEGFYKNPLTLVDLQYKSPKLIQELFQYWADTINESFKEDFLELLKTQLSTSGSSSLDFFMRLNRNAAYNKIIELSPVKNSKHYHKMLLMYPGNTIQVRFHFDRPYFTNRDNTTYSHPYYEHVLKYFQLRGLIAL